MPEEGGGNDGIIVAGGDNVISVARTLPSVCGVSEWPEKLVDPNVDLSAAGGAHGAAIVSMPVGGGDARGMVFDGRMNLVNDQSIATSYDKVGISFAANRYAATTLQNGSIDVWMMTDDLTSSDLLTTVQGNLVAKQTFLPMGNGLVMPVGTDTGMKLYRFADSYEPSFSYEMAKTDPVVAMSAASTGNTAFVAWTTGSNCYLGSSDGFTMRVGGTKAGSCPNPRFAVEPSSERGVIMFEQRGAIKMMMTDGVDVYSAELVTDRGTAPRALFDGKNFWVSWIDLRGQVIAGIVDMQTRHVTTVGVLAPGASASSYELAMVNGSPWVLAAGPDGYSGRRLCAVTQ